MGLRIDVSEGSDALSFQAVAFPQFSVARLQAASLTGRWERKGELAGLSLILFVSRGDLEIDPEAPYYQVADRVLVCPPGPAPVSFAVRSSIDAVLLMGDLGTLNVSVPPNGRCRRGKPSVLLRSVHAYLNSLVTCWSERDVQDEMVIRFATAHVARSLVSEVALLACPSGILAEATQIIQLEYADPALDPRGIAGRLGISRRTLDRAFVASGRTPASVIRQHRLNAALTLLDEYPESSRQTVASWSGFGSVASMKRALKVHHEGLSLAEAAAGTKQRRV